MRLLNKFKLLRRESHFPFYDAGIVCIHKPLTRMVTFLESATQEAISETGSLQNSQVHLEMKMHVPPDKALVSKIMT